MTRSCVVDDEGLAPKLERRAWVRDAEPDEVPDGQPGVALEGDERVLVVELGDAEARLGGPDRAVGSRPDPHDHGQVLVDREITAAGTGDREARLRRGDDRCPDLDGGFESRCPRRRAHAEGRAALVEAVVVGDVGTAAQDDADGESRRPRPAQLLGHDIGIRAAASGHDDLGDPGPIEPRLDALHDLSCHGGHPADGRQPGLGRVATDHAFVERDAREPQRRGSCFHGGRDGLRLVERPDPGPAAAHPDVDEDRQGAHPPRQPARHPLDAGDRVDEDQQLRATGVEDAADPVEPGLVDDLVRDEDPLDPRVDCHLGLPRMGDGDRPGAGIDLPAEDRRRHGRLAVGRERDPAVATEVGEDRDVVGQRRLPEHEDGQADGRVEERATEPGVRGRAGHR